MRDSTCSRLKEVKVTMDTNANEVECQKEGDRDRGDHSQRRQGTEGD